MTDKPDMCAALRKWADRLRDENSTLAESLAGYADAWEAERARISEQDEEITRMREWRDYAEQRIRTWRQRTMNRSGDRLAIDDFMGADSIDDLIDWVCDEHAGPGCRQRDGIKEKTQ